MKKDLHDLANAHHLLWRGHETSTAGRKNGVDSGFPELNRILPAGGWPRRALTEVSVPYWGMGELRLLLPAMVRLNRQQRQIVWVAPPYLPYAPALMNAGLDLRYALVVDAPAGNISWAMERLLHTESCGMVLAWPARLSALETRRLQLAAETGDSIGVVLRTIDMSWRASAAALCLHLQAAEEGMVVDILKARGVCLRSRITVNL